MCSYSQYCKHCNADTPHVTEARLCIVEPQVVAGVTTGCQHERVTLCLRCYRIVSIVPDPDIAYVRPLHSNDPIYAIVER